MSEHYITMDYVSNFNIYKDLDMSAIETYMLLKTDIISFV